MKKVVLIYGVLAGIIVMPMIVLLIVFQNHDDIDMNMLIGYTNMLLAFSMIFFGVNAYRKKQLEGSISFFRALSTGLLIAFIGATIYVIAWVILSKLFYPNFADDLTSIYLKQLETSNLSPTELSEQKNELIEQMKFYKTNIGLAMYTYLEILMVGIPIAIITAISMMFLNKKKKQEIPV